MKAACKELGLKVDEKVMADLGYGNRIQADIRITFPDGTQMALVWDAKKKVYEIKADFYNGTVKRLLGNDLRKLKQAHSIKKLESVARRQGYRVTKGKVDAKTGDQQLFLYQM